MLKLSIIIPVLNEAQFLSRQKNLLKSLLREGHEIIIVDGGSKDKSVQIARSVMCETFVTKASRGYQLQFGATKSKNDTLLFMHADTILPKYAPSLISDALTKSDKDWGRFSVSFNNSSWIFSVIAWFMNKRSCLTGIATGDHAIFINRDIYISTGGFEDIPIMEDISISKRLKKFSMPICLPDKVITSSRKWEAQGIIRTILKMWILRMLYFCGISARKLEKLY